MEENSVKNSGGREKTKSEGDVILKTEGNDEKFEMKQGDDVQSGETPEIIEEVLPIEETKESVTNEKPLEVEKSSTTSVSIGTENDWQRISVHS